MILQPFKSGYTATASPVARNEIAVDFGYEFKFFLAAPNYIICIVPLDGWEMKKTVELKDFYCLRKSVMGAQLTA